MAETVTHLTSMAPILAFALLLAAVLTRVAWILPRHIAPETMVALHPRHPLRRRALLALSPVFAIACAWAFEPRWLVLAAILYLLVLLLLAWIDAETGLLPDLLTLPLLWLGLLVNLRGGFVDLHDAVLGVVLGYLLLYGVYWGFRLKTGREGLGHGDIKLVAAMGAWLGWAQVPWLLLVSATLGLLAAAVLRLTGRLAAGQAVSFGPYLAVAGIVLLFARRPPF